MKKILLVFLCFIILGTTVFASFIPNSGADLLKFTDLDENPNIGYTVGLMYYDVWRYNNGNWTSDGKPGERHTSEYTYRFHFPNDMKVKNVKVYTFNPSNNKHMSIWDEARGFDYNEIYKKKTGSNIQVTQATSSGIGTNKINIDVAAAVTLVASEPEILPPKPYQGQNVVGLRYYIPIIIELEFEETNRIIFKYSSAEGSGAQDYYPHLSIDEVNKIRAEKGLNVYPNSIHAYGSPLRAGDSTFIRKWGPYDIYTEIYVYFIPNWVQVVEWDEKKVKETPPTEIIRLRPGETVKKEYTFTGTQYSGYDDSTVGVGYAVFQSASKSYMGVNYSDVFEEFKQAD